MESTYLYISDRPLIEVSKQHSTSTRRPHPAIFESWLPWACNQLNFSTVINIQKTQRSDVRRNAISATSHYKFKTKAKTKQSTAESSDEDPDSSTMFGTRTHDREINIDIVCINRDLVQIKFTNNLYIPPRLFKVIALIANYHTNASTLIINSGLDATGIYELGNLLVASCLTEVFLDGCNVQECNYYVLLSKGNSVAYLSLSRCGINDEALKLICDTLCYNGTASKTLKILTLSSNDITDVGAGYIAYSLRTNRKLKSLNLADNKITDVGSDNIISILGMFNLTFDEMKDYYERRLAYLKKRQTLIHRFLQELKIQEQSQNQAQIKKKNRSRPKLVKSESSRGPEFSGSSNVMMFAKAKQMAIAYLGRQDDPFSLKEIITSGLKVYSSGNSSLSNLNLSYNNLTYNSLIKICEVLYYQLSCKDIMGGVVKIRFEGNPMPVCEELQEIDNIMYSYIDSLTPEKSRRKLKIGIV